MGESKVIRVDDEVYARLVAERRPEERNFSGAVARVLARADGRRRLAALCLHPLAGRLDGPACELPVGHEGEHRGPA